MRWTKSSATGSMRGRNVPTDCGSSMSRCTPDRRRYHSSPLLRASHSHIHTCAVIEQQVYNDDDNGDDDDDDK